MLVVIGIAYRNQKRLTNLKGEGWGEASYLDVYSGTRECRERGHSDCQCRAWALAGLSAPRIGSGYGADPKSSGSSASLSRGLNRYVYVRMCVCLSVCMYWCFHILFNFQYSYNINDEWTEKSKNRFNGNRKGEDLE